MKVFQNILSVMGAGEDCEPVLTRAVMLTENNQASLTVIDEVLNRLDYSVFAFKPSEFSTPLILDE
ncbi:hypothetical protein [Psychromonas sp.]|uniref:hypothetical protein n=1 Tax=Psychromonas sp. TaxID=1884585 RepID=UPI003564B059